MVIRASLKGIWARITAWVDDALPMPPDQRAERDEAGIPPEELAERRRTRLEIRGYEKRGQGTGR
jgi:hypothetical protein